MGIWAYTALNALINSEIPGGMCVYLAVPYYMSHVKHPKGHSVYRVPLKSEYSDEYFCNKRRLKLSYFDDFAGKTILPPNLC